MFGSLYLLLPAASDGFTLGALSPIALMALLALATLPTILGFFCTTKAIEYLKPSQVQALELTEPLFAALLALVVLDEVPRDTLYLGGGLILLGLCFSNELIRSGRKAPHPPACKVGRQAQLPLGQQGECNDDLTGPYRPA